MNAPPIPERVAALEAEMAGVQTTLALHVEALRQIVTARFDGIIGELSSLRERKAETAEAADQRFAKIEGQLGELREWKGEMTEMARQAARRSALVGAVVGSTVSAVLAGLLGRSIG